MEIRHVVWDWNGTLLDDVALIAEATSRCLGLNGAAPLDVESYRAAFRRPIQAFYEHLLGRPLEPGEFARLDRDWHALYEEGLDTCRLFDDVEDALLAVDERGWGQSICSMYPHDELRQVVAALGLERRFRRIDGSPPERRGGRKAEQLREHVDALGLAPRHVVMIGDSLDDAEAAEACGSAAILLTTGLHLPEHLETAGVPVAASVLEALDLIEGGVSIAAAAESA